MTHKTMEAIELDTKTLMLEAAGLRESLVSLRRQFHRRPELGLDCQETAGAVVEFLDHLGLTVQTGMAQTGVIGVLTGDLPGPVVALRMDMDALPMEEETGLEFASQHPGRMHACGHDGHTAIGLGVAGVLSRFRDRLPGTIKFIFQPGEESPGGAKFMVREGALKNPDVSRALGFHIYPALQRGTISFSQGTANAGDISFRMELQGKGGHAARPYQCHDPIVAAGRLIADLQTLAARQSDPLDPVVISIAEIHGGQGHNIIPNTVNLRGTIRYRSDQARQRVLDGIADIGVALHGVLGVTLSFDIEHEDPPLTLDQPWGDYLEIEARLALGADRVVTMKTASMGAEDFSWFSREVPCAYLRLGAYDPELGHTADLHNSHFDFHEDILVEGTGILAFLLTKALDYPPPTQV